MIAGTSQMDKQHILDEIRRTAKANGGIVPGVRMFFRETGIKESDWKGKLWARWGDAIREAGLKPNQLQAPYDDTFLIEKYISLMRELGRFPVISEIRMKVRTDASFPNDKTFLKRFGSKQQVADRILDYCRGHAGFEDAAALCAAITDSQHAKPNREHARTASVNYGFVYLLKAGRHYKIGHSNSAGRREYELAIQLPEKPNLIHKIRTDDPAGIEAYWHKRFYDRRKGGEWFELTGDEVRAFKSRKVM